MDEDLPVLPASGVTEVVRYVVSQLAPEELEVVDAVAEAWLAGDSGNGRSKRAPGAAVGFGVEAVLLCELLFPIVSGAIGDVLGTIALEPGRLKRKGRTPRSAPAEPGAANGSGAAEDGLAVPLTTKQAEDLRAACQRHARALGLPPAKAALLADAVLGSVTGR
jgi:hypothetical protein